MWALQHAAHAGARRQQNHKRDTASHSVISNGVTGYCTPYKETKKSPPFVELVASLVFLTTLKVGNVIVTSVMFLW